jgi:cytochrome bd-type quinol oxidase subunit 1
VWSYQFLYESKIRPVLQTGLIRVSLAVFMVLYLFLFSSGGGTFIYFQF